MKVRTILLTALIVGGGPGGPTLAVAQTRALSESECRAFRERLAGHAALSEGVRRSVAALAPTAPAPAPAAPASQETRADAIRTRLEQIRTERQVLEDQRLAAMVRFEVARAGQIQVQIQGLDAERSSLERELAALPAAPPASPAPAAPAPAPAPAAATPAAVDRVRCEDLAGALESAVKTRQRELGAREGQLGAIPLVALKGQTGEQIAGELAGQFAPWPQAVAQVGLLDSDGDARLDGFVDVPAPDVFRLYRQRPDGTVSVEAFLAPGRTSGYGETVRRIDETTARQTGQKLADLLAIRSAGGDRVLAETARFGEVRAHFLAGNFADVAKVEGGVARSLEFQNFRGESIRMLEVIAPTATGVMVRRIVAAPAASNQERWEELDLRIRPVSYWRTDVEVSVSRQTRTTAGAPVASPSTSAPVKFSVER